LKLYYPIKDVKWLKAYFWRTKVSIRNKAMRMLIRKTDEYLSNDVHSRNLGDKRVRCWINHHMTGKRHTTEAIQKIKTKHFIITPEKQCELLRYRKVPWFWELEFKSYLENIWIKHIRQYPLWDYVYDFYLTDYKICVEIDWYSHRWWRKNVNDKNKDDLVNNLLLRILRIKTKHIDDFIKQDRLRYLYPEIT
jgi:hypothetical protein